MSLFQNAIVIITGAGSGIGRQLTIQAAAERAFVLATDVDETGLAETKQQAAGNVTTARLDVSDPDAILMFADRIVPTLANNRLILVNNAGFNLFKGIQDTALRGGCAGTVAPSISAQVSR